MSEAPATTMNEANSNGSSGKISTSLSSSVALSPAAATSGTVSGTVSRLTQQAVDESAAALARVKDEQRRLQVTNNLPHLHKLCYVFLYIFYSFIYV